MIDTTNIDIELINLHSAVNSLWAEYVVKSAYELGLVSKEDYFKHIMNQLRLIKDNK